jgi:uncharacterized membrane protein YqjE
MNALLYALVISTIWEGYQWHMNAVIGVILILCGNAIFFTQTPKFRLSQMLKRS